MRKYQLRSYFGIIKNIFSNILKYQLSYIVEPVWSVKWDGLNITRNINSKHIKSRITITNLCLKNQIIHFGSPNVFFKKGKWPKPCRNNKHILTWFHIVPEDPRIKLIKKAQNDLEYIHVSCNITKKKLINAGVDKNKIIVIPLGVDLSIFKPSKDKESLKRKLGLPLNKIIIGSFQKDGVSWGKGLKPKLIKGPDVFCDVVEKLAKKFDIHILLTGPARGYVKNRLIKARIPFTHKYLKHYPSIVKYYQVLDLYLVTSRVEGGPKAILESMACGVPLVSTRVGMAPEVIKHGKNGFITKTEDIKKIVYYSAKILSKESIRKKLIKNGLKTLKNYSLKKVAEDYYQKLYKHLLKNNA